MTIASATSKSGPYACNGVTVTFVVGFTCFAQTDLQVVRTDTSAADTTLVMSTDYTVALNSDQVNSPGGTITLTSAPATGYSITILRNVLMTQGASFPNQGGWYPKVVETALDKLTMETQQLQERLSRAVVLGVTQTDPTSLINSVTASASNAAASASASAGSASAAAGSATSASGSVTSAAAQVALATTQANNSASSAATAAATAVTVSSYAPVPLQTGNALKFLYTNGTVQSWQFSYGFRLVNTAGATLTDACLHAFLTNTSYTMPDLTTMPDGFGLMALSNSITVPANVTTSDGWSISTGMSAGTFKAMAPIFKNTPHGYWGNISMTPSTISTITGSAPLTVNSTVQLSATVAVILYNDSTNYYAVAVNPSTGVAGNPVSICVCGASGVGSASVFADSATTFVAIVQNNASTATGVTVSAGSVSTLTVTLGSSATSNFGGTLTNPGLLCSPIQISNGLYIIAASTTSAVADLQAFSVAGTVVTAGTAVVSGRPAGIVPIVLSPCTSSSVLLTMIGLGGGTIGTRNLSAAVVSVNSSAVITVNTIYNDTNNNLRGTSTNGLLTVPFVSGTSYAAMIMDGSVLATADALCVSVSGTVCSFSSYSGLHTNSLPASIYYNTPFIMCAKKNILRCNSSTIISKLTDNTATIVLSLSGTTITYGLNITIPTVNSVTAYTQDSTGTITYFVNGSNYDKVTISGTTVTSIYDIASSPSIIISDTLTSAAFNVSGTWYGWVLPTYVAALSTNKWIRASGNNLLIDGPIQ